MYYRSNFLSPLMLGLVVIWIGFSEKEIQIFFALAIASLFINDFVVIWQGLQGELRPAGLAGSCMFLGGMFLFLCPLLLGLFWSAELQKNKKFHFCIGVILVFSLVAAIYNATRIAWIGISFLGIILFFLLQQEKKKCVLKVIFVFALGMMLFLSNSGLQGRLTSIVNMQNTSNSERILMWSSAWHMFEDHLVIGVGVGNYKDQFQEIYQSKNSTHTDQIHPHNVILSIFSQAGIIGGLAYLAMIIYFLYESFCMWKRTKSLVALLFFSILLGYLINGLTDCNFGGPFLTPLNDFYYFMLACYLILSGNVHYSQKK
jgi:O-antigen ligase